MAHRGIPLDTILDLMLDAVCVVDPHGRFLYVSPAFSRILGYDGEEVLGRNMIEFVHPDDRARTLETALEIMSGQPKPLFENRYLHRDGHVVHLMWSARWSDDRQVRVAVARDITARKRAEAMQAALYAMSEAAHEARALPELMACMQSHLIGLVPAAQCVLALRTDPAGDLRVEYAVDQAGHPLAHVPAAGRDFLARLADGCEARIFRDGLAAQWCGAPVGSAPGCEGVLAVMRPADGPGFSEADAELLHFVALQVATALQRLRLQQRLRQMAQFDALTGLPNRALLIDRMETAIAAARRARVRLAVLYLDVDRFKSVNDTLGHAAGDTLLQVVAQRLRASVRDADTVARLGGDEFVVLIPELRRRDDADAVADKIRTALALPVDIDGHTLQVGASIGVALWPADGEDGRALLSVADAAMYALKRRGA
ncbi:diguanylate cyclase domain-containing protein [Methyloversatilis thermotolerans]|uniref:diguanylate cyclase domain-containing protein n=1 Tax=Methyloversatilis thermotolerans TaxID=1346290 RepID=UPI00036068DC|nr:diguanylate cyclase [Methyloversatilis thermotolerans]